MASIANPRRPRRRARSVRRTTSCLIFRSTNGIGCSPPSRRNGERSTRRSEPPTDQNEERFQVKPKSKPPLRIKLTDAPQIVVQPPNDTPPFTAHIVHG